MKATTANEKKKLQTKPKNKLEAIDFITKNPFPYILIIVFSIAIYSQTFKYGLINWDDEIVKENYPLISKMSNIGKAFETDNFFHSKGNYYRPVLTVSLILDAQIAGNQYYVYHITNAILHSIICCLVFYLFIILNFNRLFALLASLIFASHPLMVNAVVWIAGRNDLLPTLFFLLSFITLIKYFKKKNIIFLIVHFLSFGLALFSKETSLLFPFFYVLFIVFWEKSKIFTARNLIFVAIWGLLILYFMILRSPVAVAPADYHNPVQNMIYNLSVIPELLTKLIIPFNLAPLPFYNAIDVFIGIIILAASIFLLYSIHRMTKSSPTNASGDKPKKERFLTIFGLLFFILLLLPGTIIIYGGGKFFDYLECRAYLPVIGIFLTLGSLPYINKIFLSHKKLLIIISSFIIIIFSFLTINLSKAYSDPMVFTNYAIEKSPKSAFAWNSKGYLYGNDGKYKEAIECYDKAIEYKPDYYLAVNNKGNALQKSGNGEEAIKCYDKSIEMSSDNCEVWYNKGSALYHLGKNEEAIKCFDKALQLKPEYLEAWNNKAIVYENLGKYDEAINCYDEALKLKPDNQDTWFNKAKALNSAGKYEDALKCFEKTLELKRDYVQAWISMGITYRSMGKTEEAIKCYDKSIEIKPDFMEAWVNKGNALMMLEKTEEAIKCYDKAIEIKPNNPEAWNNKGKSKFLQKKIDEAIFCYDKALQLKPDYKEAMINKGIAIQKTKKAVVPQFMYIKK